MQDFLLGTVLLQMHLPKSQVPEGRLPNNISWLTGKVTAYNFALSKLTYKLQTIKVSFYYSDVQNKKLISWPWIFDRSTDF